jgi:hypothetical protein
MSFEGWTWGSEDLSGVCISTQVFKIERLLQVFRTCWYMMLEGSRELLLACERSDKFVKRHFNLL